MRRLCVVVAMGLVMAAGPARGEDVVDLDVVVYQMLEKTPGGFAKIYREKFSQDMPEGTKVSVSFTGKAISGVPEWSTQISRADPDILVVKDSLFANCTDRPARSQMAVSQTTSHKDYWSSTQKVTTKAELIVKYWNPVFTAEATASTVNEDAYNKGAEDTHLASWSDSQQVDLAPHKTVHLQYLGIAERGKIDFTRKWELKGNTDISFTLPAARGAAVWSKTFNPPGAVTAVVNMMQPNGGSIRKTAHLCAVEFYGYLNADSAPDPSIGWSEEGGPRGHGACHTNEPLGREVAEIAWLGVGAGNKAQWVKGVAKDAVTYKGATVCRNAGQTASFWPVFGVVATSGQKQYCKWIGAGVYGAGTILDDFETITSGQAVGARTATVNLEDHLPPAARTLSLRGSANNVQKFSGAMVIGEERPTTNADCPLTPQSTANAAGMPRSPAPLPQLPVREIVTPNPAAVRPMEPAQGKTVVPGPPPRVLTAPR